MICSLGLIGEIGEINDCRLCVDDVLPDLSMDVPDDVIKELGVDGGV